MYHLPDPAASTAKSTELSVRHSLREGDRLAVTSSDGRHGDLLGHDGLLRTS